MQLGEGYDNPWISVSVFLAPAKSVSKLSQYHGRAIRTYDRQLYDVTFGGAPRPAEDAIRAAYLFYPMVQDVEDVVQQYRDSKDEDMEAIFARDPEPSDGEEQGKGEDNDAVENIASQLEGTSV